jgi:hypothetical protein
LPAGSDDRDSLTSDRFATINAKPPPSPVALNAGAKRRGHTPIPRAFDLKKKMTASETMSCNARMPMLASVPIQAKTTA